MGNQKGLVQRIERKLEDTVGDAFARVFGGSIVPQEVEELLRREERAAAEPVGRGRGGVADGGVAVSGETPGGGNGDEAPGETLIGTAPSPPDRSI